METIITARHCEIPDALRERAGTVAERVASVASRPMKTTVLFDVEGAEPVAELRLHLAHGEVLVARGTGEDHRSALDRAEERLKRQASRVSGRFRTARHSPADIQP